MKTCSLGLFDQHVINLRF